MIQVATTNGYLFSIDDEDFARVTQFNWYYCGEKKKGRVGMFSIITSVNRKTIPIARFVLGAPDGLVVDHIDGDRFNNCRSNLRVCTRLENSKNRRQSSHSSQKFKGVMKRSHQNFHVQITVNGKRIREYGFKTSRAAAIRYNQLAVKYHGQFARLNIV